MSKKTSFYGNFVVKYQEKPTDKPWGWFDLLPKINDIMMNLRSQLQELFPNQSDKDDVQLVTSYHVLDEARGRAYYKIEVQYPSLLGIHEILKVE